ncbi:hypothetical protein I302_108788 [Kwoniella bestiolae CBS 10118]|uniref:Uncharacterized protein n=1 Tax=Kwoniella bestiolae CBS 10118 TaxID=1296100 RepID=A0A1B9FU28_9TREE|nr:hypothetical protein I302_07925 [Kwoniella bestiolae CBS 10118]OCF22280.1 hypothetical protein I302_07925 [Kwoniella bestiolae CBS 10118]
MTVLQGSFASAVINYVTTEDRFVPPEPLFSYTYSPQPDGRPQTNERYAPQTVRIHDLREHPDLTLETAGIQLVQAQSALREEDFAALDTNDELVEENDSPLCKLYRQEIDKVLRKVFPQATKIVTYNQRTRLHKPATTLAGYDFTSKENLPLMRPHIDLTPESASDFTKTVADGASRVLIVNAWRPIRGVVMDAPLAVADARTVDQKAKVHNRTLYRDG